MTKQDWLNKYYTKPANTISKEDALDHSILKWEGLQEDVLEKYGLYIHKPSLYSKEDGSIVIELTSNTCALCQHFLHRPKGIIPEDSCSECPLQQYLGKDCDANSNSPYHKLPNAKPMLDALKAAKEFITK